MRAHKIKKAFLFIFGLLVMGNLFAQSKKEIRKYKIKTVAISETKDGKTLYDSKTTYDKNGEISEEISYNKEGNIKTI